MTCEDCKNYERKPTDGERAKPVLEEILSIMQVKYCSKTNCEVCPMREDLDTCIITQIHEVCYYNSTLNPKGGK